MCLLSQYRDRLSTSESDVYSPMNWEMAFVKFHKNLLIIDGEIDEKHALNIIVSQTVTC